MDTSESSTDLKVESYDVKVEKSEKPIPMEVSDESGISIEIPAEPQCYCGKLRDFSEPDFQCSACYKWFHIKCITFNVGNALPFMTTYHFMCKKCNQVQEEVFSKKQANFAMMCQTALANLAFQHKGQVYFSNEADIIPFLEKHWEVLTTQPRKTNKTWHANINKTLTSSELFKTKEDNGILLVTLTNRDLAKIGPSYDRFRALASQLKTDITKLGIPAGGSGSGGGVGAGGGNSRKRKAAGLGMTGGALSTGAIGGGGVMGGGFAGQGGVTGGALMGTGVGGAGGGGGLGELATSGVSSGLAFGGPKSRRGGGGVSQIEESKARLNQNGFPVEHPFNKDGYRYILVEPDPHAPYRQTWDECEHTAGKPIPGFFYRLYHSPKVYLSLNDRAHQLKVQETQMAVTGDKGYSMIRATHSVNRGCWYFEVTLTDQPEGSHTRIGWAQMLGALQAPCGYDKFSYSWRSRKGTAFHASRGHHYADVGYVKDDVVGCLIRLPDPLQQPTENSKICSVDEKAIAAVLPETYKEKPLIKFKNSYYFEEKDEVQKTEKLLTPQVGSQLVFYRNGENQGIAFSDIYAGSYYPAISLYKSVTASVNFGPDFKCPPQDCTDWRPISDRVSDMEVEQTVSDILHLVDKSDQIERMLSL